jgi:hypothetical protein
LDLWELIFNKKCIEGLEIKYVDSRSPALLHFLSKLIHPDSKERPGSAGEALKDGWLNKTPAEEVLEEVVEEVLEDRSNKPKTKKKWWQYCFPCCK